MFLRTFPNDNFQANAILSLVRHFGWQFVGTVALDDAYCRNIMLQFLAGAESNGMCIAYQEILPRNYDSQDLERLGKSICE